MFSSRAPQQVGRPLRTNEIFDNLDSKWVALLAALSNTALSNTRHLRRFVDVFPENAANKLLAEVEVERATAPTRSLPGQAPPPGHPAPPRWPDYLYYLNYQSIYIKYYLQQLFARPPNRLVDLTRPIEPSTRTKNAHQGTGGDMPRIERTGRLPHIILYPIAVFDGPALARPPVAAPAPPLRDMTPFVHLGSDGPRPLGPGAGIDPQRVT